MWPILSHTLVTLTNIRSSKVKFKWIKINQDAFREINWVVARYNLLAYPDFNEEFRIRTNARKSQL